MTGQAIVFEVVLSCVDEFRHFFEEAVLRVMGKPALHVLLQQRHGALVGLLLSERCR